MKHDFKSEQNETFSKDGLGMVPWPLDAATEWIQDNLSPEDVFSLNQLETWAYDNGFKKFE